MLTIFAFCGALASTASAVTFIDMLPAEGRHHASLVHKGKVIFELAFYDNIAHACPCDEAGRCLNSDEKIYLVVWELVSKNGKLIRTPLLNRLLKAANDDALFVITKDGVEHYSKEELQAFHRDHPGSVFHLENGRPGSAFGGSPELHGQVGVYDSGDAMEYFNLVDIAPLPLACR